jgi:hypothetical protein
MASITNFKDFSCKNIVLPVPAKFTNAADSPKCVEFPEVLLQLPKTKAAFKGVSQFDSKAPWYLSLKLEGETLKTFEDMDTFLVKYLADNSKTLIGEVTDAASIRKYCYNPIVTHGKKEGYENSRTMKLKLNMSEGTYGSKAFDQTKTKIPITSVKGNDSVVVLMSFDRIYQMGNKFGISFRLKQLVKYPSVDMEECVLDVVDTDSA